MSVMMVGSSPGLVQWPRLPALPVQKTQVRIPGQELDPAFATESLHAATKKDDDDNNNNIN